MLEGDTVARAIVIVPPFANTRCGEPPNKEYAVLGKILLVKLEVDDKAETVPIAFLGTTVTISKPTYGIAYGRRAGEVRREMRKGIGVLARNLGGGLPVVECKPDSNQLLESDVTNKDRPVESGRSRPGKGQTLDVDIGVGIRGVGEWRRFVGINDGEQALSGLWRWREGIRRRFYLFFGFCLFTSGPGNICRFAGPFVNPKGFETVVRIHEVNILDKVGGSRGRMCT